MSWDVQLKNGLWLPQTGWWMDAQFSAPCSVVTHAHSDHVGRHKELICSAPTAQLIRERLRGKRIEHILPYGQTESLTDDTSITLHPAGHILGSSLVELKSEHGTLLYTGDFKLRRGWAAEPCATPQADLLIMETTFGLPRYEFPSEEEVRANIVGFCRSALSEGRNPVLFCYSLGKTQEVLAALEPEQLPVMLHPAAMRLTKIYEQFGVRFSQYREFKTGESDGYVIICPPPHQKSEILRYIPARRTAIVSGWALDSAAIYRFKCDAAFPLSDHADYPDLLKFVDQVSPRRVLTLHGYANEFARTLRERGYEAYALGKANQLNLDLGQTSSR